MLRTRVKICGITNVEDARHAVEQGADALGLVFYTNSPRAVSIETASEIAKSIPAFVSVVALFVNATSEYIDQVLNSVGIDMLQFHGNEMESDCIKYRLPYLKALRVQNDMDIQQAIDEYPQAKAILLDTYHPHIPGGTGESFNWSLVPETLNQSIILAGGLNAENVDNAISLVNPYAVDVSGGVELGKGKKDPYKVSAFIKAVYKADAKKIDLDAASDNAVVV